MTIYNVLDAFYQSAGVKWVHSHFQSKNAKLPYIAIIGSGQSVLQADNTYYHKTDDYQLEYYFKIKDESKEAALEKALLDNGYKYEKSEDVFLEDQNIFLIYYNI